MMVDLSSVTCPNCRQRLEAGYILGGESGPVKWARVASASISTDKAALVPKNQAPQSFVNRMLRPAIHMNAALCQSCGLAVVEFGRFVADEPGRFEQRAALAFAASLLLGGLGIEVIAAWGFAKVGANSVSAIAFMSGGTLIVGGVAFLALYLEGRR